MLTISPIELQGVINAARFEIAKNPEEYKQTKQVVDKIYKWIATTNWANTNDPTIMIDELPF